MPYYLQIFSTIKNGFLDTQWLKDKSKTKDEFLSDKGAFLSTRSQQSSCRHQLDKPTNDGSTNLKNGSESSGITLKIMQF